jgi:hypothetical protein
MTLAPTYLASASLYQHWSHWDRGKISGGPCPSWESEHLGQESLTRGPDGDLVPVQAGYYGLELLAEY